MLERLDQAWKGIFHSAALYPLELTVLVSLVLLQCIPGVGMHWAPSVRRFDELARRRRLAVLFVFLFTLVGRFAVEPNLPVPAPGVHDEFSYLLAADTFASGRITNPAHPMRAFFESFHILIEPTYMSMYPPGQGLMLAFGILLTGQAIAGVWISAALAAAATCWMLQGWTRPRWALLGGLLFAIRIGWFSYWGNSYWGGCVAAAGGALLFGSIPRLIPRYGWQRPGWLPAILMGTGILLLENTRLLEGTVLSAVAILGLLIAVFRLKGAVRAAWFRNVAPPLAGVLLAGGACMLYYNYSISGSALRLPYLENRERYQVFSNLVWERPQFNRRYSHEVLRKFYYEAEGYRQREGYLRIQLAKPGRLWVFLLGPALTVAFFGLWLSWRSPRLQLAWIAIGAFAACHLAVPVHLLPHYAAPLVSCMYLLIVEGLRRVAGLGRHAMVQGRFLSRGALATCALMVLFRVIAPTLGAPVERENTLPWYSNGLFTLSSRQKMEDRLTSLGGKHLVLVAYSPEHVVHFEWVYNRADIDSAAVIWARHDSSPEQLRVLLNYYRDRRIWIVRPDEDSSRIADYRSVP